MRQRSDLAIALEQLIELRAHHEREAKRISDAIAIVRHADRSIRKMALTMNGTRAIANGSRPLKKKTAPAGEATAKVLEALKHGPRTREQLVADLQLRPHVVAVILARQRKKKIVAPAKGGTFVLR